MMLIVRKKKRERTRCPLCAALLRPYLSDSDMRRHQKTRTCQRIVTDRDLKARGYLQSTERAVYARAGVEIIIPAYEKNQEQPYSVWVPRWAAKIKAHAPPREVHCLLMHVNERPDLQAALLTVVDLGDYVALNEFLQELP